MTEAYTCDKCEYVIEAISGTRTKSDEIFGTRRPVPKFQIIEGDQFDGLSTRWDLCDECGKDFQKIFKKFMEDKNHHE